MSAKDPDSHFLSRLEEGSMIWKQSPWHLRGKVSRTKMYAGAWHILLQLQSGTMFNQASSCCMGPRQGSRHRAYRRKSFYMDLFPAPLPPAHFPGFIPRAPLLPFPKPSLIICQVIWGTSAPTFFFFSVQPLSSSGEHCPRAEPECQSHQQLQGYLSVPSLAFSSVIMSLWTSPF